jgi:hypothetical protein
LHPFSVAGDPGRVLAGEMDQGVGPALPFLVLGFEEGLEQFGFGIHDYPFQRG